jgi:hypothetical protein
MTSPFQTDKNLFPFRIIFIGTNPMKDGIPNEPRRTCGKSFTFISTWTRMPALTVKEAAVVLRVPVSWVYDRTRKANRL